ncbi:DUF362 domain-containing protein [Fibrobacter intestinalis]|uniref:DUF362 domain-containing protein n=1 Tax=Fibrobacter intestinalis TaxID=28122 RepID=UPI0023F236FF|nr:DUF362 domain-containing protein [Fibrobacter intestinalis]MDD7299141.1 DUF362 domain-containing protein [Fibrobacter intestinalis]
MDRREFLKASAGVAIGGTVAATLGVKPAVAAGKSEAVSDVYFSKTLDAKTLIALYQKIKGDRIRGKVAIKLHTGEKNGPNILPREWVKEFQAQVPNSTVVETNTLYKGDRYTTEDHREALKVNGWTFSPVDIMDEEGETAIPVKGGKHLKELHVGKHMLNYDSMIVLTHFKGHAMGGYGGSLKNIAIGCAGGQIGKKEVHGVPLDADTSTVSWPGKSYFMELMADSAKATCDHFGKNMVFLNVMRRMSVDCDCAGLRAAEPTCRDIGILASTDLLAIDQASIDLLYKLPANELHDIKERIESREGLHQLEAADALKLGNRRYNLIEI